MTRKDIEGIIYTTIGNQAVLDSGSEPNEYYVYTGNWFLDAEVISQLIANGIQVSRYFIEGTQIALVIN